MKLINAIKHQGRPFEIPDCSRNDLPQFFVDMGFKVGAEIGVYKGHFSEKFCESGLKLYAVDPWRIYKDFRPTRGQRRFDKQYEEAKSYLARYPNCIIVRKTSMEAVEDFADNSLDFVYIDGNHQFRYIAEDLSEWTKKIKSRGIISGHDFFYTKGVTKGGESWHVAHVVTAYIGAYSIPNWFVLGSKHSKPGEKRDKWRSWMFIKP